MKLKDIILEDIRDQQKKLRDCYSQEVGEEELPFFVWGKPEQETLTRLISEGSD